MNSTSEIEITDRAKSATVKHLLAFLDSKPFLLRKAVSP